MTDKTKTTEQPKAAAPTPAGQNRRGPSYPLFSLGEAIRRVGTLYEKERGAPTAAAVALNHMGVKITSSTGLRTLAALLAFGLVSDEGSGENKRVQVTDLGRDLVRHPNKASAEYAAALRKAALLPEIHQQVHAKYPDGLPTDDNLKWELERHWNYHTSAIDGLAAEIRATFDLGKVYEADKMASGSSSGAQPEPEAPRAGEPEGGPAAGAATLPLKERPMPPAVTMAPQPPAPAAEVRQQPTQESLDIPVPLITGGRATLRIPIPMTEGDFTLLRAMLLANLDGLKSAIVKQAPATPTTSPEGGGA